jgi:DNA repair exonuclease SbcCD nuclease subunit
MKLLFIGDPHIKPDNSEDVDILMNELTRIINGEGFDAIIVGGDVMHYHERLFTPALNKSLSFIDTLRKMAFTYVLVGNHDAINNSIFLTDQHWMNALKSWDNVKIVDTVVNELDFMLCPYVPPGRLVEALETFEDKKEWQTKRLIIAHQEIRGCKMGAIVSTDGDEWLDEWPHLISGHIHDNQRIGRNVYYPGTPLQHSFGDSDIRVVCQIDIGDNVTFTDIPLNVPRKQIAKATLQNISAICLKNVNANRLKIKLDATPVEFSAFKQTKEYRELVEKGVKIQLQKDNSRASGDSHDTVETRNDDNFIQRLESLVNDDETMVKSLYNEVLFDKLVL